MTAVLENANKFSYLGLRRRPAYNEVIGLIKENEALANPLPNRDATFFKASNEGSFYDGLDHLEVLKEQQQRILQRLSNRRGTRRRTIKSIKTTSSSGFHQ